MNACGGGWSPLAGTMMMALARSCHKSQVRLWIRHIIE